MTCHLCDIRAPAVAKNEKLALKNDVSGVNRYKYKLQEMKNGPLQTRNRVSSRF